MKKLLFVAGSLRAASSSRATMRALLKRLDGKATTEVGEPEILPHYNADITDNPAVASWKEQVGAAHGVVFVTPEYNYSVPGFLKNAIDWASRPAYESSFRDKPCFIVSVSGGALGGVRAQGHLKYILNGMLAQVFTEKEILVTKANTKVVDGLLDDTEILDFAEEALTRFIGSL